MKFYPQKITIPVDEVSLHKYTIASDMYLAGNQIGPKVAVLGGGSVVFPSHSGEPVEVYIVAWHEGLAMWFSAPIRLHDGDSASLKLPLQGTFS